MNNEEPIKNISENSPENYLMQLAAVTLPAEQEKTMELLKHPDFFGFVDLELEKTIVGESQTRKAILLFAAISLVKNRGKGAANNLLVNADSSAGKDYVTSQIIGLFPNSESLDRASPATFTYWKANEPNFTWDGKICKLTDISDSLLKSDDFKTFISDAGKRVIVNKDKTGKIGATEYAVKGRPVVIATTANANPSEEILNRFNIITLDESTTQTKAITERRLLEACGEIDASPDYNPLVLNAMKLLQQVDVVIPYAKLLITHLPTDIRARRDVPRILNLIRASAAFHQYQRAKDEKERVVAEPADYELARAALQKIQTGFYVSLTRGVKRAYDALTDYYSKRGKAPTVKELHAFSPIFSEKSYYDHLDKLAEKGLIKIDFADREDVKQKVQVFKALTAGAKAVTLPPYSELGKGSNDSEDSNDSKDSEDSKDKVTFESNESIESKKGIEGWS